ncbi:hypothetical protein [Phytoactinopolyspora endophytica]|uniref:hypothetical protein n=1 Tax=Phytoactinopolyspora endophytica TaxID=1642495 RepID=UPI00101DB8A5|nr:hypothetical protein [Phytoactinopolyspora endophytica]
MPRQRHRRHRRRRNGASRVVVISAIAIAIPLVGWSAIALVSNDDGSSPSSDATTDTSPPANDPVEEPSDDASPGAGEHDDGRTDPTETSQANDDDVTDNDVTDEVADSDGDGERLAAEAIEACATELTAGQAVVTEAKTGVGHWSEHINARTDLLEGRNTDAETRDIWKRTRLAGPGDLERFEAVSSTYNQLSGCDDLAGIEAPEGFQADVEECLVRADRTESAASAATDAMGDWEEHLQAMADHADGHMTADQAQDQWVEAWENAPTNINAFNEARDELEQAPACSGADE